MIWLYPLYLLGAAAVAAPILMHLRRRPPQQRVEFSTLMFLEAQTPVPVSKRRLEHWLLLLLRCTVLILMALMFARPLWHRADTGTALSGSATVLLLDRSASMRRGDLWQRAVAETESTIGRTDLKDRVAVATFDANVQPLWDFDEDVRNAGTRAVAVQQRLAKVAVGWGATDLGMALTTAAAWFGDATQMSGLRKRIVLVTDFQEGAKLEALRHMVWPENLTVELKRIDAPNNDNLGLAPAAGRIAEEPAQGSQPGTGTVRVRLTNNRESNVHDFTLSWEQDGGETIHGYLPAGASRVLAAPPVADAPNGHVLRVTGDAWDFDNRIYVAPPQPKAVKVVFLGDEKSRNEAASPLYYLSRALQSTETLAPELTVVRPAAEIPNGTHVVAVAETPPAGPASARLRRFVEEGGFAVVVIDDAKAEAGLRQLIGASDVSVSAGTMGASEYLMLNRVDATDRLMRPFADARLRDFTKLRIWKFRRLQFGAESQKRVKVIASYDNGEPAIVAANLGKGTLVLMTSGWQPADSQWALSTKFVPLLYGWLDAAGFRFDQTLALAVGDSLPVPEGATVKGPDGEVLTTAAAEGLRVAAPGFYDVRRKGGDRTLYAANLAPEEGRVTPLDQSVLRDLGLRLEDTAAPAPVSEAERERLAVSEEETRQRAWLWILAGLLAMLAAETWLAGRIKSRGEVLVPGT